jgi:hypothetical protein
VEIPAALVAKWLEEVGEQLISQIWILCLSCRPLRLPWGFAQPTWHCLDRQRSGKICGNQRIVWFFQPFSNEPNSPTTWAWDAFLSVAWPRIASVVTCLLENRSHWQPNSLELRKTGCCEFRADWSMPSS